MRKQIPKHVSDKILKDAGHRCFYCGCSLIRGGHKAAIDHIFPVAQGGTSHLANLVAACQKCNCSKGMRTPEEWRADQAKKRAAEKKSWELDALIKEQQESGLSLREWLRVTGH